MAGTVVRLGRVLAEADDRVERQAVRAVALHRELSAAAGLPLGRLDDEEIQDVVEGPSVASCAARRRRQLLGVLGPALALDLVVPPTSSTPSKILPALEL